jgi:hypothetical protein
LKGPLSTHEERLRKRFARHNNNNKCGPGSESRPGIESTMPVSAYLCARTARP